MRVLVTRPEPGASATARRLEARGFEPVLLPLSRIATLPAQPTDDAFDAVVATSANALRSAPDTIIAALRNVPLFAVGARTAGEARSLGMRPAVIGDKGAVELAGHVIKELKRGARLAYLTGKVRMPDFEQKAAEAGIRVVTIETYDTVPVEWDEEALFHALGSPSLPAALVHSAISADALAKIMSRSADLFAHTFFFCLSERIAERFSTLAPGRVFAATEASDDALMDLIVRECGNSP